MWDSYLHSLNYKRSSTAVDSVCEAGIHMLSEARANLIAPLPAWADLPKENEYEYEYEYKRGGTFVCYHAKKQSTLS